MSNTTSTPAAAEAKQYEVKTRIAGQGPWAGVGVFAPGFEKFVTKEVITTETTIKDGKPVKEKVSTDYMVPDTSAPTANEAIDRKAKFVAEVMKKQEAKEAGAGVAWFDKQIDRISEGPNEALFDDNGNENPKGYLEAYETPLARSGLSEGKVTKEIADAHRQLGELYVIAGDKNPDSQKQKMAAAGFADKASVIARMDTIGQRITKLSKTLADVKARKQQKADAKKAKEAAAKTAASVAAVNVPQQAAA